MSTTTTKTSSWVPQPILSLYSKFPLVVLPQDESTTRGPRKPVLWVSPPHHEDPYTWASADPACLRVQLLFLLRGVDVEFRNWVNRDAAPEGTLPALHLPSNQLLSAAEIRQWLDREHPLSEDVRELNGMPSQEAHTKALAYSHLVLQKIYPAYMAATAPATTSIHLPWPLNTFTFGSIEDLSPDSKAPAAKTHEGIHLPAWLYGLVPDRVLYSFNAGTRGVNAFEVRRAVREGVEGVAALGGFCKDHVDIEKGGWFLDAVRPSPLDALIASHIHLLLQLDPTSHLRRAAENEAELCQYVERVMQYAQARVGDKEM